MFELRCTVRNCESLLALTDAGLKCDAGHHFDRAKQGYWNLLQPQDRRSKNPGDCDEAVLARHRWLARGHARGLIESLIPWVSSLANSSDDDAIPTTPRIVDLGCGEGTFGPALFADYPAGYCGIDLSKKAIRLAVRGWPEATWVQANADRVLPVADNSIDCALSLFGRRPLSEIRRILKPSGTCLVAVPGEEDLIELREQVQQSGHRRSRWEIVVDEMSEAGLRCNEHKTWSHNVELDPDAIADAMAMTYRGVRFSQHARLESMAATNVTMAADLMRFEIG
ncbi:methyltransferase domain-containing protein [Neorhodopirellula lusitana]|uniref:methyltransferase domain-containing protein n=1 Tax=Neorhodopirellula lusitana TaxID=445327 RepID=UPI003850C6B7